MASTADEDETASSLPPQVHTRSTPDPRHVLSKSSPPLPHPSSLLEHTPNKLAEEPHSTTVDYKEPRRLHALNLPALLSSFEEPIWEVVQDMREQRMSLCQSLRQYVFVHAAIIEGALMIIDEERERERVTEGGSGNVGMSGTKSYQGIGVGSPNRSFLNEGRLTQSVTFAPPPVPVPPVIRPSFTTFTNASEVSMASMSSTGKRGASPTELLKEGRKGEVLLSKRPSIKRKQTRPSERGLSSDQRTVAFHKQGQGQNYYQGAGSASASAIALHLQLEMVPSSPSSPSSLS
jgi:protein-tyrosine phosphatase